MYLKFLYVYWNRLARNRKVCEVECMEQSNTNKGIVTGDKGIVVISCPIHSASGCFTNPAEMLWFFFYAKRNGILVLYEFSFN